jgi:hypothetical protein
MDDCHFGYKQKFLKKTLVAILASQVGGGGRPLTMFSLGSPTNEPYYASRCPKVPPLKQGVNLPFLAFYLVAIIPRGYMDRPILDGIVNLDLTTKNVHIFPLGAMWRCGHWISKI